MWLCEALWERLWFRAIEINGTWLDTNCLLLQWAWFKRSFSHTWPFFYKLIDTINSNVFLLSVACKKKYNLAFELTAELNICKIPGTVVKCHMRTQKPKRNWIMYCNNHGSVKRHIGESFSTEFYFMQYDKFAWEDTLKQKQSILIILELFSCTIRLFGGGGNPKCIFVK